MYQYNIGGSINLSYILTPEDRVVYNNGTYSYQYFMKVERSEISLCGKHLGNTRVTFADNNGSAQILQVSDYYPFGMRHHNTANLTDGTQRYLYNGKELQEWTNWYDYGARMYDPTIGRFTTLDPMAEKYNFQSPYLYAYNNPIRYTDYLGMGGEDNVKYNQDKNYTYNGEDSHTVTETNTQSTTEYSDDGNTKTVTTVTTTKSQTFTYNSKTGKMETTNTEQTVKSTKDTYTYGTQSGANGYGVSMGWSKVGKTETNVFGKDGTITLDNSLQGGSNAGLKEMVGAVQNTLRSYGTGSNLFQRTDLNEARKAWAQKAGLTTISLIAASGASTYPILGKLGWAGLGASTGLIIVNGYKVFHDYSGQSIGIKIEK